MKKLVILTVLLFAFAFAQEVATQTTEETATMTEMSEAPAHTRYAGVKIGVPLGFHYGLNEAVWGADLRFRATTALLFGLTLNGGVDLLFPVASIALDSGLQPLEVYAGPSIDFTVAFANNAEDQLQSLFGITPGLTAGVEYPVLDNISVFGEMGLGYTVILNTVENLNFSSFRPSFSFGFNYHF